VKNTNPTWQTAAILFLLKCQKAVTYGLTVSDLHQS